MKELHKIVEQKEKEIEEYTFQYSNAKEQIKLFENTVNEQKVSTDGDFELCFLRIGFKKEGMNSPSRSENRIYDFSFLRQ